MATLSWYRRFASMSDKELNVGSWLKNPCVDLTNTSASFQPHCDYDSKFWIFFFVSLNESTLKMPQGIYQHLLETMKHVYFCFSTHQTHCDYFLGSDPKTCRICEGRERESFERTCSPLNGLVLLGTMPLGINLFGKGHTQEAQQESGGRWKKCTWGRAVESPKGSYYRMHCSKRC